MIRPHQRTIQAIIFSKDRPMQLEALLSSIASNYPALQHIYIIAKPTSSTYKSAYEQLLGEYDSVFRELTMIFQQQDDKLHDMLAFALKHGHPFTQFFVDDQIIFRPIGELPLYGKHFYSMSIRLSAMRSLPKDDTYPFSLDGNIYLTTWLRSLMDAYDLGQQYKKQEITPNHIEKFFQGKYGAFMQMEKLGQYAVSIPHNRVSTGSHCYTTDQHHPADLLDQFISGVRIDWQSMDYSKVTHPHESITYVFHVPESTTQPTTTN